MSERLCGCIRCQGERWKPEHAASFFMPPGFRYACEICGNKRCPHHSDHNLVCTNSNEPGQKGSVYE